MATQTSDEVNTTEIQELRQYMDLLDVNIKEILEILPTLATKEQINTLGAKLDGLGQSVNSRFDVVDAKLDQILAR